MSTLAVTRAPGLRLGEHPERPLVTQTTTDRYLASRFGALRHKRLTLSAFKPRLQRIRRLSDDDRYKNNVAHIIDKLKSSLVKDGLTDDHVTVGLALATVQIRRVMGLEIHDNQLFAAWCLLHGVIAEMHTGEGKTLTAAVVAVIAGMAGMPVHVITANPYLAKRDANSLLPLYRAFGLETAVVMDDMNDQQRRVAYGADIAHVTHKQIVFDYLRDRTAESPASKVQFPQASLVPGRLITQKWQQLISPNQPTPLLRGLCFAIIDEADSVLIDDAITPLILARSGATAAGRESEVAIALSVARLLVEDVDFTLQTENSRVWLLENGVEQARNLGEQIGGVWRFERYRNERIRQAIVALHGYVIDRDYIIKNNSIVLIDAATGRPTPDRKLSNGLHRMLELKEGVECTGESEVVASTSFQRFFLRYSNVCGLTGTAHEVRGELARIYGLATVKVPRNQQSLGVAHPTRIVRTDAAWLVEIVSSTRAMISTGRPVLIGTRSVEQSEHVAAALQQQGLLPRVLNARQDAAEAELVATAGVAGNVTVATNMAGRGTDIKLCPDAQRNGGLHVLHIELNDSQRLDRQLFGRAARQGDPGSWQSILSLQSPRIADVLAGHSAGRFLPLIDRLQAKAPLLADLCLQRLVRLLQRRYEQQQAQLRLHLSNHHDSIMRLLAVSGAEDQ